MLSIEEARYHLPDGCKEWSDEKVAELRDDMYKLAHIMFDAWRVERQTKKVTPLPSSE